MDIKHLLLRCTIKFNSGSPVGDSNEAVHFHWIPERSWEFAPSVEV